MEDINIKRTTNILKDAKDIGDVKRDMEKTRYAYNMVDDVIKQKVIEENYESYYWMNGAIALLPNTETKNKEQMRRIDYQYILQVQYKFMELYCEGKEIEFIDKEF